MDSGLDAAQEMASSGGRNPADLGMAKLEMIWNRDPDRWGAFGLTCILMAVWVWSPLGSRVVEMFQLLGGFLAQSLGGDAGRDAQGICADLALWSWPITGLAFYSTVRFLLRRRRLREMAKASINQPVAPQL